MASVKITKSGHRVLQIQSRSGVEVALKRDDVKDWDDEELQYGRRRDKNGTLSGRPPSFIPKACHDELHRRMRSKAEYLLTKAIPELIPHLVAIAKGDEMSKPDQVRAINMVLERVMGKPVEHVQVSAEVPWQDAIMEGIVGVESDFKNGNERIIDVDIVRQEQEEFPDEDDIDWEDA